MLALDQLRVAFLNELGSLLSCPVVWEQLKYTVDYVVLRNLEALTWRTIGSLNVFVSLAYFCNFK